MTRFCCVDSQRWGGTGPRAGQASSLPLSCSPSPWQGALGTVGPQSKCRYRDHQGRLPLFHVTEEQLGRQEGSQGAGKGHPPFTAHLASMPPELSWGSSCSLMQAAVMPVCFHSHCQLAPPTPGAGPSVPRPPPSAAVCCQPSRRPCARTVFPFRPTLSLARTPRLQPQDE